MKCLPPSIRSRACRVRDIAAPNLTSRPLRFKVVRNYLIAYTPDQEPLWIGYCCGRRNARDCCNAARQGIVHPSHPRNLRSYLVRPLEFMKAPAVG